MVYARSKAVLGVLEEDTNWLGMQIPSHLASRLGRSAGPNNLVALRA